MLRGNGCWNGRANSSKATKGKRVLIAVDTNVLLDQAAGEEDVLDALRVIRRRISSVGFIATSTVLSELAWAVDNDDDPEVRRNALTAITSLESWGYDAQDVIPVGKGIIEQIARKFHARGIVPDEEENDATIIAEAALLGCAMLLSSDGHLLDAQSHPSFREVLKDSDVDGDEMVIAKPRTIAMKFDKK